MTPDTLLTAYYAVKVLQNQIQDKEAWVRYQTASEELRTEMAAAKGVSGEEVNGAMYGSGSAVGQEAIVPPARPTTAAPTDAEPPPGALDESPDEPDEPDPRKRPGEAVEVESLPF